MSTNVLLGYPDEIISQQYINDIDFTTSKIGGQPNWIDLPPDCSDCLCSICGNPSSLIVQIYAPLENSNYHRTLYVFACTKEDCWNRSESWKCLRGQKQILPNEKQTSAPSNQESVSSENRTTDWLSNADDWGSDEDDDMSLSQNNCMVQNARGNSNLEANLSNLTLSTNHEGQTDPQFLHTRTTIKNENSKDFLTHPVNTTQLVDQDLNANPAELPGAIGGERYKEEHATAEIEIDTEKDQSQEDIVAMESLETETCDMNNVLSSNILQYFSTDELAKYSNSKPEIDNPQSQHKAENSSKSIISPRNTESTKQTFLTSYFIAVDEEIAIKSEQYGDHELQLLMEYKSKEVENEDGYNSERKEKKSHKDKTKNSQLSQQSSDRYEKAIPKHGDVLLHKMISTIKRNPGQVLRYTRDVRHKPLFMAYPSEKEIPSSCNNCGGPLLSELQLLSSLIPFLKATTCEGNVTFQDKHCQNYEGEGNINETRVKTKEIDNRELSTCIEYGTIIIYTCQDSCLSHKDDKFFTSDCDGRGSYFQEHIFLQSESL